MDATADLERRLKRLEDLQEITQLLVDYGELLDLRDLDGFAALWAEDAEFVMSTGRSAMGRAAIREMLAAVMARSPAAAMHIETNPRIHLDGDAATSTIMYAAAFTQSDGLARVTMLGHHHDDLVRTPDGWKIKRRRNVVNLPETGHP
ncbi:MAG TPA: nuclear transport factor 2 family protein [Ilumatobacteraceae bacterium]